MNPPAKNAPETRRKWASLESLIAANEKPNTFAGHRSQGRLPSGAVGCASTVKTCGRMSSMFEELERNNYEPERPPNFRHRTV